MTTPSPPRLCRCGDPKTHHERGSGPCSRDLHPGCGCDSFQDRPAVGDEAERWLASRTPGQGALQRVARPARFGTCSVCGEAIRLRNDGLIRSHRLSALGGSAGCDGSGRPPVEDEPGNDETSATGEAGAA